MYNAHSKVPDRIQIQGLETVRRGTPVGLEPPGGRTNRNEEMNVLDNATKEFKVTKSSRARFNTVVWNFDSFRTSFILANGTPHHHRPTDQRKGRDWTLKEKSVTSFLTNKFVKFLLNCICNGHTFVNVWSDCMRWKSVSGAIPQNQSDCFVKYTKADRPERWDECKSYRGKTLEQLFTASTLGGSILWELDPVKKREKEEAIRETWHSKHTDETLSSQAGIVRTGLPGKLGFRDWYRMRTKRSTKSIQGIRTLQGEARTKLVKLCAQRCNKHKEDKVGLAKILKEIRNTEEWLEKLEDASAQLDPAVPFTSNSASLGMAKRPGGAAKELHDKFACPNVFGTVHARTEDNGYPILGSNIPEPIDIRHLIEDDMEREMYVAVYEVLRSQLDGLEAEQTGSTRQATNDTREAGARNTTSGGGKRTSTHAETMPGEAGSTTKSGPEYFTGILGDDPPTIGLGDSVLNESFRGGECESGDQPSSGNERLATCPLTIESLDQSTPSGPPAHDADEGVNLEEFEDALRECMASLGDWGCGDQLNEQGQTVAPAPVSPWKDKPYLLRPHHDSEAANSLKQQILDLNKQSLKVSDEQVSRRTLIPTSCQCVGHPSQPHDALTDFEMYSKCLADLLGPSADLTTRRARYLSRTDLSGIRTNAQVEYKGKVRVSSLHSSTTTEVSRTLTAYILKRLNAFSEIKINGQTGFVLRTDHNHALLGSADIRDATGNLSHELLSYMSEAIADTEELSADERDALLLLLGPQMDGSRETKKSAHMGIGSGWPLLCLLLAYLAYQADITPQEIGIMGDDSVVLSTDNRRQHYMLLLDACGLPINETKSYDGKSVGIFCENAVSMAADGRSAQLIEITPIGQAALKRTKEQNSRTGVEFQQLDKRAMAISLEEHLKNTKCPREVAELARESIRRALRSSVEGPSLVGGSGRGKPSRAQIAGYIVNGSPTTSMSVSRTKKDLEKKLDLPGMICKNAGDGSTVPLQTFKNLLSREAEVLPRFSGTDKKIKVNTWNENETAARKLEDAGHMVLREHDGDLIAVLKASPFYSCAAKRKIASTYKHSHCGRIDRKFIRQVFRRRDSSNIHVLKSIAQVKSEKFRPVTTMAGRNLDPFSLKQHAPP